MDQSIPAPTRGRRRQSAEQEDDRDQREVFKQQHGQRRPAHRRAGSGNRQHQRGGRHGERQPQPQRAPRRLTHKGQRKGEQQHRAKQFQRAQPEYLPPHCPQPVERQFKPHRKQQQDYAKLGKRLQRLGLGNGDIGKERVVKHMPPEVIRPHRQADQNEADHRGNPKPRKHRNDDPRRAKNNQCVAQGRGGGEGGGGHGGKVRPCRSGCHGAERQKRRPCAGAGPAGFVEACRGLPPLRHGGKSEGSALPNLSPEDVHGAWGGACPPSLSLKPSSPLQDSRQSLRRISRWSASSGPGR